MIKATFGLTKEPFNRTEFSLLPQQQAIVEIIKIHSQQGGFSVVIGNPGVGKTVLREHIECLGKEKDTFVVSFSRTMHTYTNILKQLAESFKIEVPTVVSQSISVQNHLFQHFYDRTINSKL